MTYRPWPDGGADRMERELLERWRSERLFERTLEATRGGSPFVFFEGPPTANGKPGIHHVFARTIKDLICRFQTMRGRSVTRIAGWDTHGLPVEIEVEKQLKLNGKKAIEEFGVEAFNRLCRESVFTYKADWEALSNRIGYWLDYAHAYITYTNQYIETVWWLLHRLFERGLLYRGHRVLPYCPRCGTVLSSHELALGYEAIRDKSIYVTFPLQGSELELVVWTTTPWTLPSNVAAAVHPDLHYGVYRSPKFPGRAFVMAVDREEKLREVLGDEMVRDLHTLRGSDLVGRRYQRPLEVVAIPEGKSHSVVLAGDFVTAQDGSGIVHLAPAFGADDYAAGQAHNLALLRPVAGDGTFQGTTWPEIEGRLVTAEETNDLIIRRLKADGRWLRTEPYDHDYPFCWRCSSKLIYYARDSWFVRTSALKERMLELNRSVAWQPPEVGSGRFGSWLENNVDWALSRDRYWGTPLPVWVCDREASHVDVVGSYAHLADRWGRPLPPDFDPHKPYIDGYDWRCACGGTMHRVPEVIDTWFDSGAMPYAQWHYPFEHEAEFRDHFPADYICEGVDQTRGWFYSLLAIATTAFDSPAYRHVIVNELVLDADGQKMSKSKGNVVDPWQMIGEFGADTLRLYLLVSSQVWLPKRFDPRQISQVTGDFLRALRNSYEFFRLYASRVGGAPPRSARTEADRWILRRLERTVEVVTAAWEGYEPTAGVRALMDFVVDDLSNWYVRISRERFWAPDAEADTAASATLWECLVVASRLLAPAAPFASDWLHRALTAESVHLGAWPRPRPGVDVRGRGAPVPPAEDAELEAAMDAIRRLASLARAAREQGKLRVRQPIRRMRIAVPRGVQGGAFRRLLETLRAEVNVKEIHLAESDTDLVRLKGKANFRSLGKRYGKDTPSAARTVETLTSDQLRTLEAGGSVSLHGNGLEIVYFPEDVVVEREVAATGWLVQSDGPLVVALDPELDSELTQEGLARELVHYVQRLRKEAGLAVSDRIDLGIEGLGEVLAAAEAHRDFIMTETLARRLSMGTQVAQAEHRQAAEVDGYHVTLTLRRHGADA
ncbi:MAG TPA: isoleucine--tRNA ligase [Gemmatimonadales bacterium]|nr:isoleucine--tRNA ligase [Gemmatimonadales bacterium]